MAEPAIVGTQVKFIKDATTLPKTLSCYQNGGANSYIASEFENSNYQVPAGKHYVITKIYFYTHDQPTQTVSIHEHTSASTAGGTEKLRLPYITVSGDNDFYMALDCYVDISSGNYINVFHQGIGSPVSLQFVGVELDN